MGAATVARVGNVFPGSRADDGSWGEASNIIELGPDEDGAVTYQFSPSLADAERGVALLAHPSAAEANVVSHFYGLHAALTHRFFQGMPEQAIAISEQDIREHATFYVNSAAMSLAMHATDVGYAHLWGNHPVKFVKAREAALAAYLRPYGAETSTEKSLAFFETHVMQLRVETFVRRLVGIMSDRHTKPAYDTSLLIKIKRAAKNWHWSVMEKLIYQAEERRLQAWLQPQPAARLAEAPPAFFGLSAPQFILAALASKLFDVDDRPEALSRRLDNYIKNRLEKIESLRTPMVAEVAAGVPARACKRVREATPPSAAEHARWAAAAAQRQNLIRTLAETGSAGLMQAQTDFAESGVGYRLARRLQKAVSTLLDQVKGTAAIKQIVQEFPDRQTRIVEDMIVQVIEDTIFPHLPWNKRMAWRVLGKIHSFAGTRVFHLQEPDKVRLHFDVGVTGEHLLIELGEVDFARLHACALVSWEKISLQEKEKILSAAKAVGGSNMSWGYGMISFCKAPHEACGLALIADHEDSHRLDRVFATFPQQNTGLGKPVAAWAEPFGISRRRQHEIYSWRIQTEVAAYLTDPEYRQHPMRLLRLALKNHQYLPEWQTKPRGFWGLRRAAKVFAEQIVRVMDAVQATPLIAAGPDGHARLSEVPLAGYTDFAAGRLYARENPQLVSVVDSFMSGGEAWRQRCGNLILAMHHAASQSLLHGAWHESLNLQEAALLVLIQDRLRSGCELEDLEWAVLEAYAAWLQVQMALAHVPRDWAELVPVISGLPPRRDDRKRRARCLQEFLTCLGVPDLPNLQRTAWFRIVNEQIMAL